LPITTIQALSMFSAPAFGALSDKLGRSKPLLVICFSVFAVGIFMLYTNTGALLWVTAVVEGLVGFGIMGLLVIGWMKVLQRPELISLGMGVFVLIQSLGQFLGSFIVQPMLGPDLTHWVFASFCLLAIMLSGLVALLLARFK
jgi:MFS family permease